MDDFSKIPGVQIYRVEDQAALDAYTEACSHGPRSYVAYAEILRAIADGHSVEWQAPEGTWTYQHPSHTLNEIKTVSQMPERYRVQPPTPSHPAITQREESLIQMLRSECDHAARNNMRLPPTLEHRNGRLAVPEEYIDAVVEGWHREHGIPFLRAAPQDQPPTTA